VPKRSLTEGETKKMPESEELQRFYHIREGLIFLRRIEREGSYMQQGLGESQGYSGGQGNEPTV